MKVLFAVSTEDIAEKIIKVYQKEYKEIISSKNVYYFNAIIKELQRNQTYDRIVISEDLEPFTNNNYEAIDKFIFEKLDGISDEAIDKEGRDIPIIVICSERREKADNLLVKLFSIGVYDALVGNDRTIEKVASLLNKPRTKKEAKTYYKIEQSEYEHENENNVSEVEIQNILTHYRKLGKNEDKYVESFDSIAEQYNDEQLKIIAKFLPMDVKAVLEAESPKYQSIITYSTDSVKKEEPKKENNLNISKIIDSRSPQMSGPVIIPSAIKRGNDVRKISEESIQSDLKPLKQNVVGQDTNEILEESRPVIIPSEMKSDNDVRKISEESIQSDLKPLEQNVVGQDTNEILEEIENIDGVAPIEPIEEITTMESQVEKPVKRGRGRPKKVVTEPEISTPKRGRGRPRKNTSITEGNEQVLPGFEEIEIEPLQDVKEDDSPILPELEKENNSTMSDLNEKMETLPGVDEEVEENQILPGFENETDEDKKVEESNSFEEENKEDNTLLSTFDNQVEQSQTLPGFEDETEEIEILPSVDEEQETTKLQQEEPRIENNSVPRDFSNNTILGNNRQEENYNLSSVKSLEETENEDKEIDISYLLTQDKKIVSFVGTSKNGVSFLVNNIAEILSNRGIKTAIVDLTRNKNSYYIYTENNEELRETAYASMENLKQGNPEGIEVNKNLTVYTSSPNIRNTGYSIESMLTTLIKNYSLVLLDCDYATNKEYFRVAQEIYMVQSMDVLTIQPLTEFLRRLKLNNVLQPSKLRAVINMAQKVKGLNEEIIIGGMSTYNDPEMSIQDRLFDMKTINKTVIPFDIDAYSIYLSGIANCEISTRGYNKMFMNYLNRLADKVYPVISGGTLKKKSKESINNVDNEQSGNRFSNDMSNTLAQMKRQYK